MSSSRSLLCVLLLGLANPIWAAPPYPGIGRAATAPELAAWDTDVRPDFKGLPKGSGSVARGMGIWEGRCASCHGVFGESNEVFQPIVGGTTAADITRGRVASLQATAGSQGRTTLMKLSSLSTLWDYIQRAMPWNEPRSLSADDTYAVTAYILHLGNVVGADFTLSDRNMREVQARLPNRDGMGAAHGLWPGIPARGPDVKATACMRGCAPEAKVASLLPEHARDAHGNLAEQNRLVGAQRGANTAAPANASAGPGTPAVAVQALLKQHNCLTCHGIDSKIVGPALKDITHKHASRADATEYLEQRIVGGASGVWGTIAMPPQSLPAADARAIATWLSRPGTKP